MSITTVIYPLSVPSLVLTAFSHRKSECPNERVMKCRNCDEIGHLSKECPKPRDYSRVQCNNCLQYG